MAYDDDFVCRVCCCCGFEGCEDTRSCLEPAVVETLVRGTAGADVGRDEGEVDICDVVADGSGAAEGEDGEGARVVKGDVTGYVCVERTGDSERQFPQLKPQSGSRDQEIGDIILLKFVDGGHIVGFNERTIVACGAG